MKYEYVNVKSKGFFKNRFEYRDIVDKYAKKGYRFVGWIPATMGGYGMIDSIDLIFEKDEEEEFF